MAFPWNKKNPTLCLKSYIFEVIVFYCKSPLSPMYLSKPWGDLWLMHFSSAKGKLDLDIGKGKFEETQTRRGANIHSEYWQVTSYVSFYSYVLPCLTRSCRYTIVLSSADSGGRWERYLQFGILFFRNGVDVDTILTKSYD